MESIILTSLFFGVFLGYLIGLLHRHRLERSNDKMKATLVKKDYRINQLEVQTMQDEIYIGELEKQVEFYIEQTNPKQFKLLPPCHT